MEYFKSTPVKLTKAIVAEATTTAARVELRDSDTKGLILRISSTGHKVFVCKFRNGRDVITAKLGTPDLLELKEARALAAETRARTIRGTIRTGARSDRIVTLGQLLVEGQPILAQQPKGGGIWIARKDRQEPDAVAAIKSVFEPLLDTRVKDIAVNTLIACISGHTNRQTGKASDTKRPVAAPGAASRATSYLATLFNWAANRGKFTKAGSGRAVAIALPDLSEVYRPSTRGKPRERHLSSEEAGRLYPLVHDHNGDEGLAALFFQWITASRGFEVEEAEYAHMDLDLGVWRKRVKGGKTVSIGLPPKLVAWIKQLPSYQDTGNQGLLFRNTAKTGPFRNWSKVVTRLRKTMACGHWTPHDLRRTSTTAVATITSDAFARWELPGHSTPQVATDAWAEVHKFLYLPQQNDVREYYEPHNSPWVVNNRITRTREMIAWPMRLYEAMATRVASGPLETATPANAPGAPHESEANRFPLAS